MGFFDIAKDFLSSKGDYEVDESYDYVAEDDYSDINETQNFDSYDAPAFVNEAASASRVQGAFSGFKNRVNRNSYTHEEPSVNNYSAPASRPENARSDRYDNSFRAAPDYSRAYERPTGNVSSATVGDTNIKITFPTSLHDGIENLVKMVMSDSIVVFGLDRCSDPEDRRKIILFTAGIVFAKNGHFYRPRNDFFIIIPDGVKVEGQIQDILREEGFIAE